MLNKYNNLIYQPTFVSYNDFMSNKNEEIHKMLYEDALEKFLVDFPQYNNTNTYIKEINEYAYWVPSSIYILGRTYSLKDYWNNEYVVENIIKRSFYTYIDADSLADIKIKYIDYVKGKVTVFSKYTGKEFIIPFSLGHLFSVDSEYTLENTFYNKHKNGNY